MEKLPLPEPPKLPDDTKARMQAVLVMTVELQKSPAFAWFLAHFKDQMRDHNDTVLSERSKKKDRRRARYFYQALEEVTDFVREEHRKARDYIHGHSPEE
jgi:hypothetical protein